MKRKVRLLCVSHLSTLTGAETSLYLLLKNLDRERFEPVVVFPNDGPLRQRVGDLDIPTVVSPIVWWTESAEPGGGYLGWLATARHRVERLAAIIEEHAIDLVHTNVSVVADGALAALAKRVPHIWHVRETLSKFPTIKPFLPLAMVYALIGKLSERVVVVTEAVKRDVGQGVDGTKLVVLHNGIDVEDFVAQSRDTPFIPSPTVEPGGLRVGALGSFIPEKGFDTLVEAAALVRKTMPHVQFHVAGPVGDVAYVQRLQHRVDERALGSAFFLHGFCEDVVSFIRSMDVMAVPSRIEAMSRVTLESMALSKPIVATHSGEAEDVIVDGESGLLVPVENPQAMAEAIGRLLREPAWAASLGVRALERVKACYPMERHVGRFESICLEALEQFTPSQAPGRADIIGLLEVFERVGNGAQQIFRGLEEAVIDKDRHIQNLEAVREHLDQALQERDTHVENLEAARDAMQKQVGQLEQVVEDKDTQIQNLEAAQERTRQLADRLTKDVHDKDAHIRNLEAMIAEFEDLFEHIHRELAT
ncbi:MAG: glycosyltransferase [Acidobacteriota bacterium]